MHGIIHLELKKFVLATHGSDVWNSLVESAGLVGKRYPAKRAYEDSELLALVSSASEALCTPVDDILESFGEFIAPDLISLYSAHVNPSWKTLDFLENAEGAIHHVVRANEPESTPPRLIARRQSSTSIVIEYRSDRKMCALARGIVRGVAEKYGESVDITEPRCMHKGSEHCEIVVSLNA